MFRLYTVIIANVVCELCLGFLLLIIAKVVCELSLYCYDSYKVVCYPINTFLLFFGKWQTWDKLKHTVRPMCRAMYTLHVQCSSQIQVRIRVRVSTLYMCNVLVRFKLVGMAKRN